jgi:serine/threonine-protein kinase
MDEVLEIALAKNPNIRTKTVGELAQAVGRAYNLDGDHKAWAKMPTAELARAIEANRGRAPARVVAAESDPFAHPDPFAATRVPPTGTAPLAQPMQPQARAPYQSSPQMAPPSSQPMMHNPPPVYAHHIDDGGAVGIPQARPPWLIAVAVGIAALLVGGGIVFALIR